MTNTEQPFVKSRLRAAWKRARRDHSVLQDRCITGGPYRNGLDHCCECEARGNDGRYCPCGRLGRPDPLWEMLKLLYGFMLLAFTGALAGSLVGQSFATSLIGGAVGLLVAFGFCIREARRS